MPSQWTKCKKARDFYNCMKYNSSKIQNWHSALLLAAQVGKIKRFLCSDWPPSGQDGRILSTCSLLILLLLLLLFVCMDSYSITVHEIHNRCNLVSRSQVMGGETGAHLKTPTDENYVAVCSPMLTACQDLLYWTRVDYSGYISKELNDWSSEN